MSKLILSRNRIANLDDNPSAALGEDEKQRYEKYLKIYFHYYSPISRETLSKEFYELALEWKKDTKYLSSITEISMHHAYQKIIGMGEKALPLILQDLSKNPYHWFWALNAITGANPVKPSDRGKIKQMAKSWFKWAEGKGIKW